MSFLVFPIPAFSATAVCVLTYSARSWQLRSFMFAASSSAAQIHQEAG